ncbi:MAG: NADH-quinone oxidoreductase subunit NuoN [Alphaproteobacteria bacterium]
MDRFALSDLGLALPEVFLACVGMVLLVYGAYRGARAAGEIAVIACIALVLVGVLVLTGTQEPDTAFNDMFIVDSFAVFVKILILLGAILGIVLAVSYLKAEGIHRFEYVILILFATLGMMMMVSANDLIALYLGLETQSLSLYVLAAFHRDTLRSSEAGLKYFVLGALSSGMLLYGASMIYGYTGTTGFTEIARQLADRDGPAEMGLIVGIVFVAAGLAFKISAVPFHMWTPDVYEGAPTPVTAFFSVAPKVAAIALFMRVLAGPFGELVHDWQQIIIAIAVLSMLLGAFAAINQTNIKRLMAYSSIGHVGYALVGFAAGTPEGITAVLVYMAIYVVTNVGAFACILAMRRRGRAVEEINDLAGLQHRQRGMAIALTIIMFSMAGIPPMAGFVGKLVVFGAAIEAGLTIVAIIGVLASVVSAFYYLRIVKLMWFDEATEPFDKPADSSLGTVMFISAVLTLLFVVYPAPLIDGAAIAADALF